MAEWGRRITDILKKEMTVYLAAFYVDDVRFVTNILEKGKRWSMRDKKFIYRDEWRLEDEAGSETDSRRTTTEVEKAMNSIFENIQFETEIPEDFLERKLPTLDFKMWMEEETGQEDDRKRTRGKVMYSFFEKAMASPFCVMASSALSESSKISCLSQDLIRRMVNTSEMVGQEERDRIIERYISKLTVSGYNTNQIKNIIESGLKGYETKLEKSSRTGESIHRSAKSTQGARIRKKLTEKSTWFRKKKVENAEDKRRAGAGAGRRRQGQKSEKDQVETVTVLFVPRTPGGELAERLRKVEREISFLTGDIVKIVERSGSAMKGLLVKSNPGADGGVCDRKDCPICNHGEGKNGNCKKRNVVYKTICDRCKEKGQDRCYYGETSRTGFERGGEHWRDYRDGAEESHMYKHWMNDHFGESRPRFTMQIVRSHMSAFSRQIHEAVLIDMNGDKVLNSKGEFNTCQLPRLSVMIGDREHSEKEVPTMTEAEEEIEVESLKSRKRAEREEDGNYEEGPICKKRKQRVTRPVRQVARKRERDENQAETSKKKVRAETVEEEGGKKDESQHQSYPVCRENVIKPTLKNLIQIFSDMKENPKFQNSTPKATSSNSENFKSTLAQIFPLKAENFHTPSHPKRS